ncbi:MAG: 30S ribosomal protein S12 methylthiotransferase RimO [Firmicutes bacterium]|nr:30S ribosomal protein S12 methylthiotransferase RimO [Bacillota bacterium]
MSVINVALIALGCAKNLVDSENISASLVAAGFKLITNPEEAEVIIVNTCGFIESAKEESITKILEMAQLKTKKCRVLIAAGCLAQRYGEELLAEIPELDGIFGTNDLNAAVLTIKRALEGKQAVFICGEYNQPDDAPRLLSTPGHSAYLKIAEGCDNHCTYCAIPAIRGPYRSRRAKAILAEANRLAEQGVKEINLIAQDITMYGSDQGENISLSLLLRELEKIAGIKWIRLLYAYPDRIDDTLIDTMAELEKVCPYLDLPLQHGSNNILRRMGRKLEVGKILALLEKLRRKIPGIVLRSSFIIGFPGETEADFQQLLQFLEEAQLDRVGFFTYSREEGTPAARYPGQIPEVCKRERLEAAIAVQSYIVEKKQQALLGRRYEALVDGRSAQDPNILLLRSSQQAPEVDGYIRLRAANLEPGTFVPVVIKGFEGYDLLAGLEKAGTKIQY